ncbi:MAG: alanyl-tRNA synthetase [Patescibacteria group bacterium]|nr:alanyl-tRNA synthetase [Patescibacteria group bacterium]
MREKYLAFCKKQGHTIIPSSSLVPENDPTTLFTGSGMQPLVPYLLGKNHPSGSRLADSQKCFRSGDIEEVGDNRHTTFFEMLGNWSLGDYFKKEQLPWFFEFLTKEIGLDPQRLYVTAFMGDEKNGLPKDSEATEIWQQLFAQVGVDAEVVEIGSEADGYIKGMSWGLPAGRQGRIFYYDAKKNWWSRAGVPENMPVGEPGGPDSEVFYEFTDVEHDSAWGEHCHPNCDCGRFLEIGNSVFMQYIKQASSTGSEQADDSFGLLPKLNVDFGGGLERIAAVSENSSDIFLVGPLWRIISELQKHTEFEYGSDPKITAAYRVIADHMRSACFLMADGVVPSNADRGYFLRRLIRRSVRYADKLNLPIGTLASVYAVVMQEYQKQYPELTVDHSDAIRAEEDKFRETLHRGMKEFTRFAGDGSISAKDAFQLVTTYGFPLELIIEEAGERGIKQIDTEGFKELLKQHQDLSRAGSEQKFKGGLADTSEKTTRLHTTHHLLLKALQIVLGPGVKQRGSNITQERLRIDFSWPEKMTEDQKREVERIVNEKIAEDLPVIRNEMAKEDAEKLGAEHEFGAKYPERVSVYSVGPKNATEENPQLDEVYSIEFCGGPHVTHTGELSESGTFKILKEEAVSAGIRRIRAVLE